MIPVKVVRKRRAIGSYQGLKFYWWQNPPMFVIKIWRDRAAQETTPNA